MKKKSKIEKIKRSTLFDSLNVKLPKWKFFDRKIDLVNHMCKIMGVVDFDLEKNAEYTIMSKDISVYGSKRFLLCTYEEFFKRYDKISPKHRMYHEVLQNYKYIRLFVDIEADYPKTLNKHLGTKKHFIEKICYGVICKSMYQLLRERTKLVIPIEEFSVLDASSDEKFSVHIHCISDLLYFKDKQSLQRFIFDLHMKCVEKFKKETLNPFYVFKQNKDTNAIKIIPLFDMGAVTGASIRCFGCIKMKNLHNEHRRLKEYSLENGALEFYNSYMLQKYMVHYVNPHIKQDLTILDYKNQHDNTSILLNQNKYVAYCKKNKTIPESKTLHLQEISKINKNNYIKKSHQHNYKRHDTSLYCNIGLYPQQYPTVYKIIESVIVGYYNDQFYNESTHLGKKQHVKLNLIKINQDKTKLLINIRDRICPIAYAYHGKHTHNNKTGQCFILKLTSGCLYPQCRHPICKSEDATNYVYNKLTVYLDQKKTIEKIQLALNDDYANKTLDEIDVIHDVQTKKLKKEIEDICMNPMDQINFTSE